MASRSIDDLHPDLQVLCKEWLRRCEAEKLGVLITCTYRSGTEQDALYAQGRTKPGAIVTRAKAGQSAHNHTENGKPAAKAFDFCPYENGVCKWDTAHPTWQRAGQIAMELGLTWYGAPGSPFKEFPHIQLKK